jgi:CBS domain-containing protein
VQSDESTTGESNEDGRLMNSREWLKEQLQKVEKGEQVELTVRSLLSKFHAEKRGRLICAEIDRALDGLGLVTWPDFRAVYIDGLVELKKTEKTEDRAETATETKAADRAQSQEAQDPVPRLAQLPAANQKLESVSRDMTIEQAVTKMMMHDFSQLPVMQGERDPDGYISWKTIGRVTARGGRPNFVREAMEACEPVRADLPLAEAIELIVRHDFVLVKGAGRKITGLVTTSDISTQFHELARPFILISQIEGILRSLLDEKFELQELESVKNPGDETRTIASVSDLTLGECVRLLQPEDRWKKLAWGLDRVLFVDNLDSVRRIRNDIMHFNPDPLDEADLKLLEDTARCLGDLLP